MRNLTALPLLCVAATATAFGAIASTPIGVATASGHFTVEGSQVWGNSTLFEGSRIETTAASSELALRNGVRVQLAAGSAARVWNNRLVLEKGTGQVSSPAEYQVGAGSLNVTASGGRFRVALQANPAHTVQIAALTATTRVMNEDGRLLATVPTGRNMSFAMLQAIQRTGCLVYKNNRFLLAVDNSQEVIQLNGPDLAANVGNRVAVTGTPATERATVPPASSVLNVTAVSPNAAGGCLTIAAGLDAQTTVAQGPGAVPAAAKSPVANPPATAQAGKSGGLSTGAKVAIIGGAAGGGIGAAFALSGKKDSTSP